jgi:hypothetical protein
MARKKNSGFMCVRCYKDIKEEDLLKLEDDYFHKNCHDEVDN